jgi:O-antigen ligase
MQNGCGVPTEVLPEGDDYGCVSGLRPRWYVPRQSSGAHPRQRGAGVAVRRVADIVMGPSVWLALAVLLLALAPAGTPGSSAASPSDVALGIAGLLVARQALRFEQLAMLRSVPAVGFLAIGAVTLATAALAADFPKNLIGGIRFVELFTLAPIAVMVALRTRLDTCIVLGAIVGLGAVEGVIGLVQFGTGTGAGVGGASIRAVGTFGAYNIGTLSDLTAVGFIICLAVVVVRRGRLRWFAAVGATLLLLANVAALSRGAWVAIAIASAVVVSRGRPGRLLAAVVVGGLLAALVLPPLAQSGTPVGKRLGSLLTSESTPDHSVIDRKALWNAAWHMALDHPLTGVGVRTFPDHRDSYAGLSLLGSSDISEGTNFQRVALDSPHDLYLLIASEQGLVALSVWVAVLAVLGARGLVRVARRRSDSSTTLALMGVGLLAYELVAVVSGDIGGPGSILIGLAFGLAGWAAADFDLVPRPRLEAVAVTAAAPEPAPRGRVHPPV